MSDDQKIKGLASYFHPIEKRYGLLDAAVAQRLADVPAKGEI